LPCRLDTLVQGTDDLRYIKYAIMHLGEGVNPNSPNRTWIDLVRQNAITRYYTVLRENMDPRLRRNKIFREIIQRRQETINRIRTARWQLELDLQKLAQLERTEQLELFLRQIHLQGTIIVAGKLKRLKELGRESPEVLRSKLADSDAETRWMAIQVVGIKRYPLESDLINRLSDRDNAVRRPPAWL
jgi:hypothetical protein